MGGMGTMYKENLEKHITKVIPLSDKLLGINGRTDPIETLIIHMCMTASGVEEKEVEKIYEQAEDSLEENGKGKVRSVIPGDWNSAVGRGKQGNVADKFGLERMNENGENL